MIETIGLALLVGGWLHAVGWFLLGATGAVAAIVFWLVWLFKWNR